MIIRRILLLLAIAFSGLTVHAQEKSKAGLETQNYENRNCFISKIIDCRDQLYGSVIVKNRAEYIEPIQKIESENWLELISEDLRSSSLNGTQVILKINWLNLDRTLKEMLVTANIDFYVYQNDTYYYEFNAAEFQQIVQIDDVYDLDLTDPAIKMIEQAYFRFRFRMDNQLGYHEMVSDSHLESNSLTVSAHFDLYIGSDKNGIYYTYDQFRDQIKDTISSFSESNHKKSSRISADGQQFTFDKVHPGHVWGVDYGGVTYIKFDDLFYPALRVDQGILIHKTEVRKKSSVGNGALIGLVTTVSFGIGLFASSGLILTPVALGLGTGIGAGIGALIPRYSYQTMKYSLDYLSGKPVFIGNVVSKVNKGEKVEVGQMHEIGKITFYFPQKAYTPLSISVDGEEPVEIQTKSYFEFQADPDDGAFEYCLYSDNDQFCENILSSKIMPVAYEIFLEKDGQVSCVKIDDASIRKKYNRWAENGSLKRVK